MESAPLTLAHTHARNAALETQRSNPVAASEEHDLAAAEFATAAQRTSDKEALRILHLLEQHHKRLGTILRTRHEKVARTESAPDAAHPAGLGPSQSIRPSSPETTTHPPRLPKNVRSNTRDLSSSIASNLASARGIPSNRQKTRATPISPLVSNQHADGHIGQDESKGKSAARSKSSSAAGGNPTAATATSTSRQPAGQPTWTPPLSTAGPNAEANTDTTVSDAPFQQFYSTFESLISKISAPLAFAGLPLTAAATPKVDNTAAQPSPTSPRQPSQPTPAAPTVDYSQMISRAALRAVSGQPAPHESFYVVPPSGGTISYAEIMSRAEREEARGLPRHIRQSSNLTNISEDDFVDAQSQILPSHERRPRSRPGRNGLTEEVKHNGKTMEELSLENHALRQLSDTLSRRLHVFEMSAQTSSAALAQSILSLHRSPLTTPLLSPENSRGKHSGRPADADEATARRIAELEEILRKSDARIRKKEEENLKLKDTIARYKDKWDSLKAGAKARRERERERTKEKGGPAEKGGAGEELDDGGPS